MPLPMLTSSFRAFVECRRVLIKMTKSCIPVSRVCDSLKKNVAERPSYARLLEHPFLAKEPIESDEVQSFVKGSLLEFAKEFGLSLDEVS